MDRLQSLRRESHEGERRVPAPQVFQPLSDREPAVQLSQRVFEGLGRRSGRVQAGEEGPQVVRLPAPRSAGKTLATAE